MRVINCYIKLSKMQNYRLEAQQRLKSIYNPRKKVKGNSMFPKIHRLQLSPAESKPIIKGLNKKYRNNDNIFKKQDEKPSNRNVKLQEQKIVHSKQYEQLQLVIADCRRKHLEELSIIQMKQKDVNKQIQKSKKESYNSKLSMWELKNQVIEIEQLLKDEQEQYNRLCYDLGYVQNQNGELQYAQQQENEEQMNNYEEGQQIEQNNYNNEDQNQFEQNERQQSQGYFDSRQRAEVNQNQYSYQNILAQSQQQMQITNNQNIDCTNRNWNHHIYNSKSEKGVSLMAQSIND